MMSPVFAEAARQIEPDMRLVKIDSEQEKALSAQQLAILSIPTLLIFRQGKEIARMSSAPDLSNRLAWVGKAGAPASVTR